MKLFIQACLAAGAMSLVTLAQAQAVTETQVKNLLTQMDQAIASRNVDGVTRWLADDVRVSGTLDVAGQQKSFAYGKDEYAKALFDTWGSASQYSYKRENQVIRMQGSSAVVTADIKEQTQIGRQLIKTQTQETATVELRKGQPRITRVEGKAKVVP